MYKVVDHYNFDLYIPGTFKINFDRNSNLNLIAHGHILTRDVTKTSTMPKWPDPPICLLLTQYTPNTAERSGLVILTTLHVRRVLTNYKLLK